MNHASAMAPVTYRADSGRQRAFLSFTDAAAYDRGYRNYPLAIHAEVQLGGSGFDLIIHRSGDTVVAEFEKQPARAPGGH